MDVASFLSIARWTTPPLAHRIVDGRMHVAAAEGSDAWRTTSYGFVHDSEHALLAPFGTQASIEVSFLLDFTEQFDQAGLFLRVSPTTWIKAGVEVSDGVAQVGAVVTREASDWSVAPVPEWAGRTITVRASRSGDAVTIRARADDEPFRLVRVAPLDPASVVEAGLFCCAPTRAGLEVTFTGIELGEPDSALHA